MHQNFYFLRNLCLQLNQIYVGATLQVCFSQQKEELYFQFAQNNNNLYILAHLRPSFSCLVFPPHVTQAKRNVATVFDELVGCKVLSIRQFENERAFAMVFENDMVLVFKMYGVKSNLLLYQNGKLLKLFKNSLKSDFSLSLTAFDKPIDQSAIAYHTHGLRLFPTLDTKLLKYYGFDPAASVSNQYLFLQNLIATFQKPQYQLVLDNSLPKLIIGSAHNPLFSTAYPVEALNNFYKLYQQYYHFAHLKNTLSAFLQKQITKYSEYLQMAQLALAKAQNRDKYQHIADVLMANLHVIPAGAEQVTLFNFYSNTNITIKLRGHISAQKNAENYYQKAKSEYIELESFESKIKRYQTEIHHYQQVLEEVRFSDNFHFLQKTEKSYAKNSNVVVEELPFKLVMVDGYQILIGKNAQNNDLLTQQYAKKNDFWLHARDVTGSHVVIKAKAGHNLPKNVQQRAAELAAYYSKRRNDSLCPVIFTQKKYVRKPKNLPAGKVVIDREEVLLVVPKL
jgi:predicted ribosome quality control (RQC) complex YloA/Tae2 family protein